MVDLARRPVHCQAVRLPIFWSIVRRICYVLAQKGNPAADQQPAVRS
ncbi:hypothetical protein [[Enterobacter] lignolyticus]|uniref:Uncharacterized protein n=1 Tax=Enterobacter lignolyticus (strain SCF1) TaxID=701347 RepID=E3G2R0_ENTLS|nr:hypothetical protein [[Enterobacter] lignolyticus]ADO48091.1 hypothetical protein Entcl_1835 [[Enterobacter] lignolyticus SCF1]